MSLEIIEEILGPPYFKNNECLIYNMDCLEGMKKLSGIQKFEKIDHPTIDDMKDKKEEENKDTTEDDVKDLDYDEVQNKKMKSDQFIHLTLTSPPYNIGKEYETSLTVKDYVTWFEECITQVYLLSIPNATCYLNLGYTSVENVGKAVPISYLLWDKIPFYLIQEIVWNYGAGVAGKKFFSPRNEKFLWYVKHKDDYTFNLDAVRDPNVKYPNQTKNGKLRVNPLGKNPSDVWQIPKVTSGRACSERTKHPAQFPAAVVERIIKASSNKGDIVFDPFLGSGTTAEVALRLGRKFVGFEIKKEYCKIAANRILKSLDEEEKLTKALKSPRKKQKRN